MLSALSHSILAKVVFLISRSIAPLYAVRSVFKFRFGAFSCQKRSPTLRRLNCSATMHWKVGPSTPPSLGLGSSIPLKKKAKPVFGYKFYQSHYKTRKICIAGTERNYRLFLFGERPLVPAFSRQVIFKGILMCLILLCQALKQNLAPRWPTNTLKCKLK